MSLISLLTKTFVPSSRGKTYTSLPGTEQKSAYGSLSPYAIYRGLDGSTYVSPAMSTFDIVRNFESIAPLNAAVLRLANAVGALPWALIDTKTEEKVTDHPAIDLLNSPNMLNQKLRQDLMRDTSAWKSLSGAAYWVATGNPKRPPLEIFPLNPLYITVKRSNDGVVNEIRYTSTESTEIYKLDIKSGRFFNASQQQELWLMPNMVTSVGTDGRSGLPTVSPLYYEINQYLQGGRHNLSLLKNGARPAGAFVLKSKDGTNAMLAEDQFERLKTDIQNSYTGANNAGRPLILEGGMEWQEMQMSSRDMDFQKMQTEAEEAIFYTLGVPLQLVKSIKATANNMSNIRLEFYENTVLPIGDEQAQHFNRFILPRYPNAKKLKFVIDRESIDVLTEQRSAKRDVIEKSLVMTVNEKRAHFNMEPIEGGDKIVDPNGRPIAGEDIPDEIPPAATQPQSSLDDSIND